MGNLFFGLNIGRSAMLANQAALDVTGHNLANVQTEGYSRQRASMTPSLPIQFAQHTFGSGVSVEGVARIHLGWVERQINRIQVQNGYDAALRRGLDEVQALLAEPSSDGLGGSLTQFWNAWEALTVRPGDAALRAQVLDQASHLAAVYNQKIESFLDAESRFDEALADTLGEVNVLAKELADLNASVAKAEQAGRSPNDLLDQRDRLLRQITEKIGVEVETDGPYLNLRFPDGGPPLVNRVNAFEITTGVDERGYLSDFRVGKGPVNLAGGEIGALLALRDEIIPGLREELSAWMAGVVDGVNRLHTGGFDRDGVAGGNFFAWEGGAEEIAFAGSAGLAGIDVSSDLEPGTHHLQVVSVDAALVNNARGDLSAGSISLSATGTFAGLRAVHLDYHVRILASNTGPSNLDGLRLQLFRGEEPMGASVQVSGAGPATVNWAAVDGLDFQATIDLGGGAVFVAGERSDGLSTTGTVSLDGGAPAVVAGATSVTGGGDHGFLPGGVATVTFSGAPFSGASFTVYGASSRLGLDSVVASDTDKIAAAADPSAPGDGEVARRIAELATEHMFEATDETATDYLGRIVQALGAQGQEAAVFEEASSSILLQLEAQKEGISGVNVDEEMVLLIQYQRGFQAAARFLTTVDGLLDNLINGVGR